MNIKHIDDCLVSFCSICSSGSDLTHWTAFQTDDSVKIGLIAWQHGAYSLWILDIRAAENFHMRMSYLPM